MAILAIVSLLPNPWKIRVFSFIRQMWQVFKTLSFPSLRFSQTPFNPKSLNTKTPSLSRKNLCKITSRYVFLNIVFIFDLDYANFSLGFWKIGTFEKLGWGSYFCEIFFKILIWLSPIWCLCICVGPLRHSKHVLRQFSPCSCIVHSWISLLHAKCLTECPSDILVLNWTQLSSNAWI